MTRTHDQKPASRPDHVTRLTGQVNTPPTTVTDGAGSAPEDRTVPHLDEATVNATGRLSEALEWVERARGALYSFHQLSGRADIILGEALDALREAGHEQVAGEVRRELYGRNVLDGRWTFQIVEEYDDLYYRPFVATEERVRDQLTDGHRHVYEARMKARERTEAGRDLWGFGP
nr:hypothetical protein [Frankia sp. R43]